MVVSGSSTICTLDVVSCDDEEQHSDQRKDGVESTDNDARERKNKHYRCEDVGDCAKQ
jgi:hypothetical protein